MTDVSDLTRFLLYLLLVPMLLYALWSAWAEAQARKHLLERQAAKRGAELMGGNWLEWPKLRFDCQGESVDISILPRSRYRPAQMRAEFKPQNILLAECRLVDSRLLKGRLNFPRRQRILTQDADFDARYALLAGKDPLMVFRLGQTPIREKLLACNFPHLEIETSPTTFEMSVQRLPFNDESLDLFIEAVLLVTRILVFESPHRPQANTI